MNRGKLAERIKPHESLSLRPMPDPDLDGESFVIGWGRNLQKKGITREEADCLLANDIVEIAEACAKIVPEWWTLNDPRQNALAELCYMTGPTGLAGFHLMLSALAIHDYDRAALEILDSHAHNEAPERIEDIASMVRTGEYTD